MTNSLLNKCQSPLVQNFQNKYFFFGCFFYPDLGYGAQGFPPRQCIAINLIGNTILTQSQ